QRPGLARRHHRVARHRLSMPSPAAVPARAHVPARHRGGGSRRRRRSAAAGAGPGAGGAGLRPAAAMARQSRRDTIIAVIARMRVALGFVSGVLVLILSRPSARSLALGMSIAAVGEAIRIWAAGHLHKSREVTASGPYRFVGHPLYVGSSVMGVGLAIACSSLVVAALIALYLVTTLTAAVKSEEAYLRRAVRSLPQRRRRETARAVGGAAAIQPAAGDGQSRIPRRHRLRDRAVAAALEGGV